MKTILLIFVPLIMFSQSYETQKYKLIESAFAMRPKYDKEFKQEMIEKSGLLNTDQEFDFDPIPSKN